MSHWKALLLNQRGGNKAPLSPWLIILLVAPIPILVIGALAFQWFQSQSNQSQAATQFLERQNSVLAYDSISIAQKVAQHFENAVSDVEVLSLVAPTKANLVQFYLAKRSFIIRLDDQLKTLTQNTIRTYNEIAIWDLKGQEKSRLYYGNFEQRDFKLPDCAKDPLCDALLIEKARALKPGQLYIGSLRRWYSNKDQPEDDKGATWRVAYRTANQILTVGMDYRIFKDILYMPSFPYQRRTDLLLSYQAGDYVYMVDSDTNIIVHPKYWHALGADKQTKKMLSPLKKDEHLGELPLNFRTYEGKKLRDYTDRLLRISFSHNGVDIFRAANIGGTYRVLSVAPIRFSKAQFSESGVLGHIVTGCDIHYFEEPEEKFMSYY